MSFNQKIAVVALALTVGIVTPATAEWLSDESQIKSLVSGKCVYLATPFGGEFPLDYRTNGRVSGDGSTLGLARYLAPKETGNWWVVDGNLCQKFPTWYKGRTNCFKLAATGEATLKWRRDDGYRGKARIEG